MSGTFDIGRLFGVRIQVHFSWIFIFALIAWSLASSWLPGQYPGWSREQYWAVGITGSVMLFVCVLVHELSHSLEAIRRGLGVESITLFFLGGVSQIEGESRSASEEFWVSIVGPIASLTLACIFGLLYFGFRSSPGQITALLQYLAIVNLMVGLFNLIPAFPLDGGRVLRSMIWRATGSQTRATRVSSLTGSVLGFLIIGIGIVSVFTNNFMTGIWLVFIGWFIQSAASSARQSASERAQVSGMSIGDAMDTEFLTAPPGISLQRLVDEYITTKLERAYPIMLGDTFLGLITVTDVLKVPAEERSERWVSEVMTKAEDVVTLPADAPLEEGMKILVERNIHQIVVMDDHSGSVIGLLTRAGVLRGMEVARLLGGSAPSANSGQNGDRV